MHQQVTDKNSTQITQMTKEHELFQTSGDGAVASAILQNARFLGIYSCLTQNSTPPFNRQNKTIAKVNNHQACLLVIC